MTESEFLETYDPAAFERPSVTVDLVLMTVVNGKLAALLQQRSDYPFEGSWALPGGFVGMTEDLETAAKRVRASKAALNEGWLEQLHTFGAPQRDPRTRVITVAYFALTRATELLAAVEDGEDLILAALDTPRAGAAGGPVSALTPGGSALPLAFDHADILGHAVQRLRDKLNTSPIAFALMKDHFTLRELQDIHEAVLDTRFNKPAFRRRMIDAGWIEGTGQREDGASYRPAELYRMKALPRDTVPC